MTDEERGFVWAAAEHWTRALLSDIVVFGKEPTVDQFHRHLLDIKNIAPPDDDPELNTPGYEAYILRRTEVYQLAWNGVARVLQDIARYEADSTGSEGP